MMNRSLAYASALMAMLASCTTSPTLKPGTWRGVIDIQGHDLPFSFDVRKDGGVYVAEVRNGDEKLLLDEVKFWDDSVSLTMHVFDSELRAEIRGDSLIGFFVKNYEVNFRLPFRASFGQTFRFKESGSSTSPDFSGRYSVTFTNATDTTEAVGIFRQDGVRVTGTFLTPTADYRYLEGSIAGGRMQLSTFDGNHAYIFYATKSNDTLRGEYWSGRAWNQEWIGIRNDSASLPDAGSLTYLKKGYNRLGFSFPDTEGTQVSLNDQRFRDKVVVIQLLGSWCHICMDEIRFLAPWYDKNRNRGVEILGLAFEAKSDFNYARGRVEKMQEKLNINYDILIAGVRDKEAASRALPELNRVVAFPTTIFVGKDGTVKYIHTGFSGPGTGKHYETEIQRFNEKVNELLAGN